MKEKTGHFDSLGRQGRPNFQEEEKRSEPDNNLGILHKLRAETTRRQRRVLYFLWKQAKSLRGRWPWIIIRFSNGWYRASSSRREQMRLLRKSTPVIREIQIEVLRRKVLLLPPPP